MSRTSSGVTGQTSTVPAALAVFVEVEAAMPAMVSVPTTGSFVARGETTLPVVFPSVLRTGSPELMRVEEAATAYFNEPLVPVPLLRSRKVISPRAIFVMV